MKILEMAYVKFYLRPKVLIKDIIQEKGFILRRAIPQALKIFTNEKENFEYCNLSGEVIWKLKQLFSC